MIDRVTEQKFPFDSKLPKGSSSLRPPAGRPARPPPLVVVVVDVAGANGFQQLAPSLPVPTRFKFENQAKTANSEAEKPNPNPQTSPIHQNPQHPTQLELPKFARDGYV